MGWSLEDFSELGKLLDKRADAITQRWGNDPQDVKVLIDFISRLSDDDFRSLCDVATIGYALGVEEENGS